MVFQEGADVGVEPAALGGLVRRGCLGDLVGREKSGENSGEGYLELRSGHVLGTTDVAKALLGAAVAVEALVHVPFGGGVEEG